MEPPPPAREFFGRTVCSAVFGEFRVVEKIHAAFETLPEHLHERPYATFVAGGEYWESVGGVSSVVTRRSVVLHPAGERHENRFAETTVRLLNVEMPVMEGRSPVRRIESDADPVIGMIGSRLRAELHGGDDLSPMIVEGLMIELLGVLVRKSSEERHAESMVGRADRLILERCAGTAGLRDLAAELGVGRAQLARAFRQEMGCTVGERIRQRRVERACRILSSHLPLAGVAAAAGFSDQSHFTRVFRAVLGLTPGQYRKQIR